jgi:hypothetical protein
MNDNAKSRLGEKRKYYQKLKRSLAFAANSPVTIGHHWTPERRTAAIHLLAGRTGDRISRRFIPWR